MDIIFLAAIAIYIFFKLRDQLGKIDEDQKRDAIKNFIKERAKSASDQEGNNKKVDDIVTIPTAPVAEKIESPAEFNDKNQTKILDSVAEVIKPDLIAVLQKANISVTNFISGANLAFEMIIEAFASGDLKTLKSLLSDKIFSQFELVIKDRQNQNQSLNTKIVAIDKSEIISAQMSENYAVITVKFISKQINYITNNSGELVEGSKEEINSVNDVWIFKKDCNSTNPNWFVFSTSSN